MKLRLSVRATNLENVAGFGKGTSDPFAVVTVLDNESDAVPQILGKTEVIKNNLDPDWVKTFTFEYELGIPKHLIIKVVDEVRKEDNIPMGTAIFEVGSILGRKGNAKAKKLKNGGVVFAKLVDAEEYCGTFSFQLSGVDLTNTEGMFRKSDPFVQFKRREYGNSGSEWNVVYKSSTVKDNLSPDWEADEVELSVLSPENLDEDIYLEVFDYESDGNHILMGEITTSVNALMEAAEGGYGITLTKEGEEAGTLVVHAASVSGREEPEEEEAPEEEPEEESEVPTIPTRAPTFTQYLHGGCEINLCVAIDFTGSNGNPREEGTLHYFNPDGAHNDYEKAIVAIGGILADYDTDCKMPVWGFGAKLDGELCQFFQCGKAPEVEGVDGVLDAYHETFSSGLVMSGPTDVTEVISTAAAFAKSAHSYAMEDGKQKYSILLVLTDGSVADMDATMEAISACSDAPLSIVMLGIGDEDFGDMHALDEGDGDLDIVQFVEFNEHKDSPNSLTKATLAEIPNQLVNFFTRNDIMPNAPMEMPEEEIVVEPEEEEEEEIDLSAGFTIPPRSY